jgi:uncharacterized membrane protein
VATLLALGLSAYLQWVRFDIFPEKVPIHWNENFDADGWLPRERIGPVLWGMPLVMLGFCGLTLLLPRISPRRFTIDTFQDTYYYAMALVVLLMGYLHGAILWGALYSEGHKALFMKAFLGGICLFFALIGGVLGKVRRNFWMGVRTPWTIASETVWNHTHRLAARWFVGAGVGGFLWVVLMPVSRAALAVLGMLVLIAAAAIVPVVYSAVLYKRLERSGELEP